MSVMRATRWITTLGVTVASAGCSATVTGTAGAGTGLSGMAWRGPITPTCRNDVPCDTGFSASFTVFRGGRSVTQFESDSTGAFRVALAPGNYEIVPDPGAPILDPSGQSRSVTVADTGWTSVELHFDTGIR